MEFDVKQMLGLIFITVLFGILGMAQNWASGTWPFPYWFKFLIMFIAGAAYVLWLVKELGFATMSF